MEKSAVLYFIFLIASLIMGFIRYKYLDKPMRVIFVLLIVTVISEACAYSAIKTGHPGVKNIVYYVFDIISMLLTIYYFLTMLHAPRLMLYTFLAALVWVGLGVVNAVLLKGYATLNTNMIMLESFLIITMSLFSIYRMLKKSTGDNIFLYARFWMVVLLLVYWSATFFFWAFIKTLYKSHWRYMDAVLYGQETVNILFYSGIAAIFLLHRKRMKHNEYF